MGLMQGRIVGQSFLIFDILRVHAESNEVAVQATLEAMALMTMEAECLEKVGREHQTVGYHFN